MKDSEICRKAADLLQTKGLANGTREDHDGSMCVLGALGKARYNYANDFRVDEHPVLIKLVELLSLPPLRHAYNVAACQLASWSNAAAGVGKPEVVIEGLRRVADILETQGS